MNWSTLEIILHNTLYVHCAQRNEGTWHKKAILSIEQNTSKKKWKNTLSPAAKILEK